MKSLFSVLFLLLLTSCSKEEEQKCITCTYFGDLETYCEENLDVLNANWGTNYKSLEQIEAVVEAAGGDCN